MRQRKSCRECGGEPDWHMCLCVRTCVRACGYVYACVSVDVRVCECGYVYVHLSRVRVCTCVYVYVPCDKCAYLNANKHEI